MTLGEGVSTLSFGFRLLQPEEATDLMAIPASVC